VQGRGEGGGRKGKGKKASIRLRRKKSFTDERPAVGDIPLFFQEGKKKKKGGGDLNEKEKISSGSMRATGKRAERVRVLFFFDPEKRERGISQLT